MPCCPLVFLRQLSAGKCHFLQQKALSTGKCIFLQDVLFFLQVALGGLRIMNGSLIFDDGCCAIGDPEGQLPVNLNCFHSCCIQSASIFTGLQSMLICRMSSSKVLLPNMSFSVPILPPKWKVNLSNPSIPTITIVLMPFYQRRCSYVSFLLPCFVFVLAFAGVRLRVRGPWGTQCQPLDLTSATTSCMVLRCHLRTCPPSWKYMF